MSQTSIDSIDHERVRELRFARPPANAFDAALLDELASGVEAAPGAGAEAIVISGGPGMFTGGLDVPTLLGLERAQIRAFWERFYRMLRAVVGSEVPVAAAITGHSPAAGAVLAVACDYRVMADGPFKIGMNEVQVGLVAPAPLQYAMKRLTGARAADALVIAGALIGPADALRVGLVDEVVPPDQVVANAVAWAQRLAALPRNAMRETRRIARAELVAQFEGLDDRALDDATALWFSDETQRALRALVARLAKGSPKT
jgi:enoyl-CoA hydratase/carnithine racemase